MVQFLMLGNLEVRLGVTLIPITAPKQRATLATLLLDVNNDVPVERLERCVWDDRSRADAQKTLHSYIYRLRRLLRPLAGVEIHTTAGGYTLEAQPAETDVWHFRQRAGHARERARDGDLRASVQSLRKALAVWRGNAMAGVPGAYLRREASFLESERMSAQEELFGAELALGRHRKIIPELSKLLSTHEFHENLSAQLMLALYRSGRQAEALQRYAHLRRRLREDIGIEPCAALQDLHQAILEQVPARNILLPALTA